MSARSAVSVLAAGCAASTGGHSTGGATGSATADEVVLHQAIEGALDPASALLTVANAGGLPVRTGDGTYLFACLCGSGDWKLAGDFNDWVGEPMDHAGDLWWLEVSIDQPDESRYKFTDGSTWRSDPMGRRFGWDENGEYSLVRSSAAHLERFYQVEGHGLAPRDLQVWVPAGPQPDAPQWTHLLVAHDGQNLFDPSAPWGGWRMQDSLPDGMLVVGIDNTSDRMDEYTPTTDVIDGQTYGGKANDYADFVEDDALPLVEKRYGQPQVIGTIGSSLGGLVAFVLADRYPDTYAMAMSLSGTFGWGAIGPQGSWANTEMAVYAAAGHRDTWLYLDSGGGGTCYDSDGDGVNDDDPTAQDNYCENIQFRDELADLGYQFDVDLFHWYEPGATHDEAHWADRVWRPLQIFASR